MRIVELNIAEFGCIKNKRITLEQGINVIYGENESGKSTLMLFIKFMLYGLPKRTQKSTDRQRALSWDNGRAAGSMCVEHAGRKYLIERRALGNTRTVESCKITDLGTGEEISAEAGELLLGVPCEIFESSCFISQMRTADINKSGASSAIENILASADESIDVSHILDRMDKVRKEYKHNRGEGGLLYDTERKISDLRMKQREATEKHLKYNEMSSKLSRVRTNLEKAEKSYESSRNMLEDVSGARILQAFAELDRQKEYRDNKAVELESLVAASSLDGFVPDRAYTAELKTALGALEQSEQRLGERRREYESMPALTDSESSLATIGERIIDMGGKSAAINGINALDKRSRTRRGFGVSTLIFGVLCAAAGGATFALLSSFVALIGLGAGALALFAAGIVLLACAGKARKDRDSLCAQYGVPFDEIDAYFDNAVAALARREQLDALCVSSRARFELAQEDRTAALEELRAVLGKSMVLRDGASRSLTEACVEQIERLQDFCEKQEMLVRDIYATGTVIENAESKLAQYDREALRASVRIDFTTLTSKTVEEAKKKEHFDRERMEMLAREERTLSDNLVALRASLTAAPMEFSDRINTLERQLEADTEYYDALMLAMKHIELASETMSGSVTPEISRRASELMAHISDGAYASVQTTKELDISVDHEGFLVNAAMLSGGTRDAAYLSLRISLMLRLFGAELPPLMMDESLCQLDDTRAGRVLGALSRLSDTAQCILFTCHRREIELCEKMEIRANAVYL